MKQQEFKEWLENKYVDSPRTVTNRISNCKNIEKYYGNLDDAYEKDKCNSIIEELSYSKADEENNISQKHLIPINGNIREGSATLKNALNLYIKFREERKDEEDNSTLTDNNTLVKNNPFNTAHNNLVGIINSFKYNENRHSDIYNLQNDLTEYLNNRYNSFVWKNEFKTESEHNDRIDIIGISKTENYKHIIELDAIRADQVAKKFVSRMALFINENICYTVVCYPGRKSTKVNETKKYFNYCSILANDFSKKKSFRSIILK